VWLWWVSLCGAGHATAKDYKLAGDLTPSHRFVLDELMRYIEEIDARIARFDALLLEELADERNVLALLQTMPGVEAGIRTGNLGLINIEDQMRSAFLARLTPYIDSLAFV
jgi:hypothetical protein